MAGHDEIMPASPFRGENVTYVSENVTYVHLPADGSTPHSADDCSAGSCGQDRPWEGRQPGETEHMYQIRLALDRGFAEAGESLARASLKIAELRRAWREHLTAAKGDDPE